MTTDLETIQNYINDFKLTLDAYHQNPLQR